MGQKRRNYPSALFFGGHLNFLVRLIGERRWENEKGDLKVLNGRYSQYLRDERGRGKAINHKLKIPTNVIIGKNTKETEILGYIQKKGVAK